MISDERPAAAQRKWPRPRWWPQPLLRQASAMRADRTMPGGTMLATIVLLIIALAAGLGALVVYGWDPPANSRELELFKALLSIFTVVILGGLTTFAFNLLLKDRDRRVDEARRDLERRLDERRRRDEQVSDTLKETLEHWLAVKQIRRELEAVTRTDMDGYPLQATITLEHYDHYLRELSKHQLAFEQLKKTAPPLEEKLPRTEPKSVSLSELFNEVEEFLNSVVDEYQRFRHAVAKTGQIKISDLAALSSKREPKADRPPRTLHEFLFETTIFRGKAGENVGLVVQRLEHALREPLELIQVSPRKNR